MRFFSSKVHLVSSKVTTQALIWSVTPRTEIVILYVLMKYNVWERSPLLHISWAYISFRNVNFHFRFTTRTFCLFKSQRTLTNRQQCDIWEPNEFLLGEKKTNLQSETWFVICIYYKKKVSKSSVEFRDQKYTNIR